MPKKITLNSKQNLLNFLRVGDQRGENAIASLKADCQVLVSPMTSFAGNV